MHRVTAYRVRPRVLARQLEREDDDDIRQALLLSLGEFSPDEFLSQVRQAAGRAARSVQVLRVTGQPPDHPVDVHCPEGRYLTGILLRAP